MEWKIGKIGVGFGPKDKKAVFNKMNSHGCNWRYHLTLALGVTVSNCRYILSLAGRLWSTIFEIKIAYQI